MKYFITEELIDGKIIDQFEFELESSTLTLQELIYKKVTNEVEKFNLNLKNNVDIEEKLNIIEKLIFQNKQKPKTQVDIEEQYYLALASFQKNRFFVLIDDLQIEDINQTISLTSKTKISFVKLTPLVGG